MKSKISLWNEDCLQAMKLIEDNSVDSLITDPPAGISFMGKEWDDDKGGRDAWVSWMSQVMKECRRVMKPGAHGLVWAIPRTSHWTATALEDAGFEVRDVITHIFGSGFPKSLDISKAIDKAAGAEREVLGPQLRPDGSFRINVDKAEGSSFQTGSNDKMATAPSTPEAKRWQGFGTALKPASEHWILVRKPLSEKTVAANVLKHGTGGINIDASRIGTNPGYSYPNGAGGSSFSIGKGNDGTRTVPVQSSQGRFPANLVLSHNEDCIEVGSKEIKTDSHMADKSIGFGKREYNGKENEPERKYTETVSAFECTPGCAVAMLDAQSGISKSVAGDPNKTYVRPQQATYGKQYADNKYSNSQHNDTGGASRFFYCAKASKADKNAGLEGMPEKPSPKFDGGKFIRGNNNNAKEQMSKNFHPTVKSTKLMSYLIKLITPPNGVVLDPFMGSGSTGVAALRGGFKFIGIEAQIEYVEIAQMRIESESILI
jgi:DNA modification methylase